MPTAELNLPDLSRADNSKIAAALYQLTEKLTYLLNNLDDQNISRGGLTAASIGDFGGQTLKVLKAEIDKLSAGSIEAQYLSAAVAEIAMARIRLAKIDAAQITALETEVLSAVKANIGELEAQIIAAVTAEIAKVTAGTVTTTELYAQIIKAMTAEISHIDAGNIETSLLYAALAEVVHLAARTADIDFAKIKDMVTDTAIISQGAGGDLYIARLRVTEANMLSLTVGELILKGEDGAFYRLTVGPDGQAKPELVQVEGDNIANGTVAGRNLMENAISARELDAEKIFADEALMVKLFAGMGHFGQLFAQSAVMPYIRANVIESDALSIKVSGAAREAANNAAPFIVGTQTATTGTWTGVAPFAVLTHGQQITYLLTRAGSGNATLKLTLSTGAATADIPCYYMGTTRLTTHYGQGNVIRLTYLVDNLIGATKYTGWWADANYDTNDTDRTRWNNAIKAKSNIAASNFIVGDSDGFFHLAAGSAFDLSLPILWAGSAITAGATGTNNYSFFSACTLRNSSSGITLSEQKLCYLKGEFGDGTFIVKEDTPIFTDTPVNDGFFYMRFGWLYSPYQVILDPIHEIFYFDEAGVFKSINQKSFELVTEHNAAIQVLCDRIASRVTETVFNAAMDEKANKDEVDGKADKAVVTALQSLVDQTARDVSIRFEKTEANVTQLQSAFTFDSVGLTIKNPAAHDTSLQLSGGAMKFSIPGKDVIVISATDPDTSYMPSLRLQRFVMGNSVTTVSGSDSSCRIVTQYLP